MLEQAVRFFKHGLFLWHALHLPDTLEFVLNDLLFRQEHGQFATLCFNELVNGLALASHLVLICLEQLMYEKLSILRTLS